MATANSTLIPIASLTDDPVLIAFLSPDAGEAFAIRADDPSQLIGGAALELAEA